MLCGIQDSHPAHIFPEKFLSFSAMRFIFLQRHLKFVSVPVSCSQCFKGKKEQ
jgi:hypothetical protein